MSSIIGRFLFSVFSCMPQKISRSYYYRIGFAPKTSDIGRGIKADFPARVTIGDYSLVNKYVQFHVGYGEDSFIQIKNHVFVAPNVCFYCVSHEVGDYKQRAGKNTYSSITVNNGAWIGANSIILPGVVIGKGSIVCAGSVVLKSIPDNEMWGGVPARFIKKLD